MNWLYLENPVSEFAYKVYSKVVGFWESLERVFYWVPIVWRNHDFEETFLLDLMRAKLKRMEPVISNGYGVDSKKHGKEIKTCILLLDRILDGDYSKLAQIRDDLYDRSFFEDESGNFTIFEFKDKESEKEFHRLMLHKKYLEDQDIRYLFKFMGRNINKWWD